MNTNNIEFYINKFDFVNNADDIDVSFIPPIARRRLSILDKAALYTMNNTYTDDIAYILFSSQFGQVDRLIKLIDQYSECNEVSPNVFSGSVHNYSPAFFLLNNQKPIPYNALASGENSLSFGLLSALISEYDSVLFCYGDAFNSSVKAISLNVSKCLSYNADKFILKFKNNESYDESFDKYIALFNGNVNTVNSMLYTVERCC